MTLVSLKEILEPAREQKYAVGNFNVLSIQMIKAVIDAAEEEKSPAILAFGDAHSDRISFDIIFPLMVKIAKKAKVPVTVHLDHGKSFSSVISALRYGASGIMYDGSSLSYEKNVQNTREICKIAHALGISVEAEIGHVAMEEGNPDGDAQIEDDLIYTNPEEAVSFIEETHVDALAISIGTAHGICLEKPKLDFDLLQEINRLSEVPLVLHGGSGVSDNDFKKAIKNGISKINFFSRTSNAVAEAVKQKLNNINGEVYYQDIDPVVYKTYKENVKEKIRVFGSNNMIF
jgi:fructose-bisphosphate aldolase class II